MSYACTFPEDFTHPKTAFFLGFLDLWIIFVSEILNIYQSQTFTTIKQLISSYVTFRVSMSLPFMYYCAMQKSGTRIFNIINDKLQILKKAHRDVNRNKYNTSIEHLLQGKIL